MIKRKKRHSLCIIGFHKFEIVTRTNGYIDVGEVILRHEETQLICTRDNCNKTKGHKNYKWKEFKNSE